jgi:HAD superfamily phosphoserine phosphatase-like hydrolase
VIVASDLEGTLTTGETWRGVQAYLEAHGRRADYARFRRSMMPLYLGARVGIVNKREFQNRWIERLMTLFAGVPLETFRDIAAWVVRHELLPKARRQVLAELEAMQGKGARVILASGTYQPILEAFAAQYGFDAIGTPLEISDDKLTGRLAGEINVGTHKRSRLQDALQGAVLTKAYGDTLPDVPMLEAAQEAVIVAGNDARLERVALERGWRVLRDAGNGA